MAMYEYTCMACETGFEVSRSIMSAVDTGVDCPSCGSERVRRRFSLFATTTGASGFTSPSRRCACGGACACGGH